MRKRFVVVPLVLLLVLLSAGVGIFGTAWAKSAHATAGTAAPRHSTLHAPQVANPPPGQLPTLVPDPNPIIDDFFGSATAVDGNTVVVGAPGVGENGRTGAVYIYVRSGLANTWTQQVELTPSEANVEFGWDVAISGSTLAIGAPGSNLTNTYPGAMYIFVRSGTTWTQQAELTGTGRAQLTDFGFSVALSADGNTMVVGAPGAGAAYAYVRSGTTWSLQKELVPTGESTGGGFGNTLAISANGNTILGGGFTQNNATGAAWVFVRSGTTWTQQKELIASDGAQGDDFATSLALSADGNTALIGAPEHNQIGLITGAAYIFVRSGTNWTQQAEFTPSNCPPSQRCGLGGNVVLTADGNTAATIAGPVSSPGAVWFFARSGSTWSQNAMLSAPAGSVGIGGPMALGAVGSPLVVGVTVPFESGTEFDIGIYLRNEKL